MKDFFRYDGPLTRFLNTLADLIILSIMWLVCSLPIVTMGASTVSLYAITMNYGEDDTGLIRRFWKAFRENFKKGSIAGVVFLLIGVVLFFDFRIIVGMSQNADMFKIAAWFVTILCFVMYIYTFPLLACYEQTLIQTMKNALLIGLSNLPATILLLVVHILPVVAAVVNLEMFVRYASLFLSFMGAGVISLISTCILKRVLAKYQPAA